MISTPEIVDVPAQKIAFIRVNTPREQIVASMHAGLDELSQVLEGPESSSIRTMGLHITSGARMRHSISASASLLKVKSSPEGRVESGELTAATVARTIYSGSYEGLGQGWGPSFRAGLRPTAFGPGTTSGRDILLDRREGKTPPSGELSSTGLLRSSITQICPLLIESRDERKRAVR